MTSLRPQQPTRLKPTRVWQPAEITLPKFARARQSRRAQQRDPNRGHYRGKRAVNADNNAACYLLCNQCTFRRDDRRCRNFTCQDFTLCWIHLMTQSHLRIAPSRIQGAGLGLYAIRDYGSWKRNHDDQGRPIMNRGRRRVDQRVFAQGDVVAVLKGESLTRVALNARYPGNVLGAYAVENDGENAARKRYYDQLCARTANAYANDCRGPRRRSRGRGCNVAMVDLRGRTIQSGLVATRAIYHGEEILTDYGEGYWQ